MLLSQTPTFFWFFTLKIWSKVECTCINSITNMFCGLYKISDRLASNHGSPFSLVDLLRFLDNWGWSDLAPFSVDLFLFLAEFSSASERPTGEKDCLRLFFSSTKCSRCIIVVTGFILWYLFSFAIILGEVLLEHLLLPLGGSLGVIGSRVGPEEGASDFRLGDCFGVEGEDDTATKYNIHL